MKLEDNAATADENKLRWLLKNWDWDIPEKKKPEPITPRSIWRSKGKKSDFRTPYRYPGKESHY